MTLSVGRGGFPANSVCRSGKTDHLHVGGLMLFNDLGCFSSLDVSWLVSETVLHIPALRVVNMNAGQESKVCLNVFFFPPHRVLALSTPK